MATLPPDTRIGSVRLTVADLDRQQEYYERTIGLRSVEREDGVARLGAEPGRPLVELVTSPDAPPRPRRSTGLFHLAVLVPERAELARALRRVADSGEGLTGASDHLVSEALYLSDPEGNGIELYRDRPRDEWPRAGGTIQMATLPLDLENLMSDEPDGEDPGMPAGTTMGHVHLQVAELSEIERFYSDVLGFDVIVRSYPGALFVSAGGYHHHIGLNTWNSASAPAPGAGSRGLREFEVVLPDQDELARVRRRLEDAGIDAREDLGGVITADPSGNRVLLRAAA